MTRMSKCNDMCKYYKNCWSHGEGLKEDGEECVLYEPDRPHGEWKADGTCSECGVYSSLNKDTAYFCPNCGADMRKRGEIN